MSAKWFLPGFLALVLLAVPAPAEPPLPLDLIPEDACIGVSARNLEELRAKSDRLVARSGRADFPRPSQLLDMAVKELRVEWKIDEKKPLALVCLAGTLGGFDADADPDINHFAIGAVVAPRSLDEAARVYGVAPDDLKKGAVRRVPGRDENEYFGTTRAGYRDGMLYLTGREKATAAWMKARTLRDAQPAQRQRRLDAADGVVYLGPTLMRFLQKDFDPDTVDPQLGPQEAEAQKRLNKAFTEARYVLAAYRVDDGVGLDLSVGFDPKGTQSQAVLKAVTGSGRTSNLNGLPDSDRLVVAFAAIGLKRGDLHLARVFAAELWGGVRGAGAVPLLLDSDVVLARRLLGDVYGKLRLGRVAVYHSSDPARLGQVSAVAVLEPNDPARFLDDIAQYARLGAVDKVDPGDRATREEIEKLVADLGSEEFEARESATTKLGLIGDAALPYLEKAEKSEDAEVHRRAADLRQAIRAAADLRKRELAEGLVKKAFHPSFTLQRDAEKRAGASVHLLGMRLQEDAAYSQALKDLFGPEWGRIRIVVVDKQVVVLLGSDLVLLDEAVRNVRDGKPGLERSAALAEFHKQAAPERRMELHFALSRVQALLTPANELPKDVKPSGAVSSVALRTGRTDMGLDLWVPAEAVPDVIRWLHL